MTRFAMKITEQVVDMASQMVGVDSVEFPEDCYLLVEMLSPIEYHAKFVSLDEVVEAAQKDPALHVM